MINQEFTSLYDLLAAFPDEQSCIDHLTAIRWDMNVVSPFDPASKVYICKGNKYRCKNTGKYFNVKTGTLFDNSKIKLRKWFMAIWIVTSHKKGISSVQLSKDISVTQKTAWHMLHRIRNCFGIDNEPMDTIVEADETLVGGKEGNKHKNKRSKNTKSHYNKVTVLGMAERGKGVKAMIIGSRKAKDIVPELIKNVKANSVLLTDEHKAYKQISGYYQHYSINHSSGQYVDGFVHTNTLEGFWSLLKRGIIGIYHKTSTKHLQKYIDEFSFRYNTRKLDERLRFNLLLCNLENRLTYNDLINAK